MEARAFAHTFVPLKFRTQPLYVYYIQLRFVACPFPLAPARRGS